MTGRSDRTSTAADAASSLRLAEDGAERRRAALSATDLRALEATLEGLPPDRAGIRLHGIDGLGPMLAADGRVGRIAAATLGPTCRAVRALLFDKTPATNWSLAWHQDRTIVVRERRDVDGFGPWSVKDGLQHVEPPIGILDGMVTLRVHLDPVPPENAPLLVVPGSHRSGRVAGSDVKSIVDQSTPVACLAEPGDVWIYATPILHASDAALSPRHRRVLQVDYAATELPGGLVWLGV